MDLKSDPFLNFFKKFWGSFFDPESLSIDLLVMVPDFFEVTFDRFFSGSPKWSKIVKNGQKNVLGSAARFNNSRDFPGPNFNTLRPLLIRGTF